MEVNEKQVASLKAETEKIAKEQGQPITGYITEYTIFYMETGAKPMISPRDSILYQYSSSSEPIESIVKEVDVVVSEKPKVKAKKKVKKKVSKREVKRTTSSKKK